MTEFVDPDDDTYYTAADVKKMFGLTQSALTRLAGQGRIPARRTPAGHQRFPKKEIDRIIREGLPAPVKNGEVATGARIVQCDIPADGQWHAFPVMGNVLHADCRIPHTVTVYLWESTKKKAATRKRDEDFRVLITEEEVDRSSDHRISVYHPGDCALYHVVMAK